MLQFTRLFPNLYFILIFIFTLVSFQLNRMTLNFFILFALLIIVAFLKERQRVFVWITIAYFFGEFLHLYANRFLNEMHLHVHTVYIIEKLLLLFPIMSILYVRYKFKQNMTVFYKEAFLKDSFSILHDASSRRKRPIFLLFIILILSLLILLLTLHTISFVGHVLLFAFISSISEEILWRGLLMQEMLNLTNKWTVVILSSISYGCSFLMYGYSIRICLIFALSGIFYAWITLHFKNLIPAIVCHFIFFIIMIVSGIVPFSPL